MIISEEQALAAAAYLREDHSGDAHHEGEEVPEELVRRAYAAASAAPDLRQDRIDDARERLKSPPGSGDLATKMLSRIVSDSLR